MRGILRGSPRSTPEDAGSPRRGQLALTLQEILTATVRLRANRQVATDAESFRSQIKQLLSGSEQESRALGYASDDIALALYAVVAFLDESVLNSAQPMFSSWPSRPLQEEIFGGHVGGEVFFEHLRQLLARQDSEDLADVLEVFQLCLLLGFQGRYSTGDRGELAALSSATADKILRIRGRFGELAPGWALPVREVVPKARDPAVRWLVVSAFAAAVAVIALFTVLRGSLAASNAEFQDAVRVSNR